MALTEESTIESINVTESGSIEVKRADKILRDGEVISKTYHRHVLEQGMDLTNEDPKVVAVAQAVWNLE